MNSLSAYRLSTAVLSIAVLVLGGTVWRILTGGGGHDGNPSGLDVINPKQTVTATLQGDIKTTMPCLTMGNQTCSNLTAELHFLQDPAPQCPDDVTNLQFCYPAKATPRTLPTCQPDEVCLSVNTQQPAVEPTPFEEYRQDADGLHEGEDVGAKFVIILKPQTKSKKGP